MFCKYIYFSKCTPINGKGGGSKHHVVEKWYNVTIVTTEDNDWKCWKWRFLQVFVANLVLERSRVFFRHQPSHKGGLPITMSPLFPETDFLRLPLKMLYSRAARMKHANYVMRDKKRGVVYTWLAIHPTKYIMLNVLVGILVVYFDHTVIIRDICIICFLKCTLLLLSNFVSVVNKFTRPSLVL